MSQVSVSINGRVYRVGCDEGQEHAVAELARDVDARIGAFRETFGEIGDMRLLVMVALQFGDELAELRRRVDAGEQELAALRERRGEVDERAARTQSRVAEILDDAATRMERMTAMLNDTKRSE